ncbi:MAG: hypothetical protein ACI959_001051, partial [Limisphaerales bacterium]
EAPGTAALNLTYAFNQASVFFNFGTDGATAGEKTYLWDDVMFIDGGGPGLTVIDLPIDWESASTDYTVTDFGDNMSMLSVDPTDGANMVMSTTKPVSAPLWAGTTMSTPAGLASVIPLTASATTMSMRVYSPDAGIPVRLKIEVAGDPTKSVETETLTTVANAWETIIFDFANEAPGTAALNLTYAFNQASVFFNFGTDGATAGEKTYLWDDVMFVEPVSTVIDLPISWDDAMIDYTVTDFGDNMSMLSVDPTDGANMVMSTTKPVSAPLWAGTTMSTPAGLANAIPITGSETTMSMRVYSPDAGIPVRLKIEDATDPTKSVETEAMTTVANAWETLTFDFANEAPGTAALNLTYTFNQASVFFNFGTDGAIAGEKTYLWDDVEFGTPAPICNSVDAPANPSSLVDPTGVTLSWDAVANSAGCLIKGGIVGEPTSRLRVLTPEASSLFISMSNLVAGETYNWRVSCGCNAISLDSNTPYSTIESFSVPVLRTASIEFNNPVSNVMNVSIQIEESTLATIELIDLSGRLVMASNIQLEVGANQHQLNLSDVPNGMYFVRSTATGTTSPVVVQH